MNVNGKTALVTGGSEGIGLEIARILKAKGAKVIICARRQELLDSATAEGLHAIKADLSNPEGCAALYSNLDGEDISILINNAGMGANFGPEDPIDLNLTDRAIFLNFNAPMHLIGYMLEELKQQPQASIVNITSGLAIAPTPNAPVYSATKAGLRSFTLGLRHNLKETNIHVVEALPPVVDTAMTARLKGKGKMTPVACAKQIVHAIEHDKDEANIGIVKLLRIIYSLSPALVRKIMNRF